MANLVEGLLAQQRRVRELIPLYESVPNGAMAVAMMHQSLERADAALGSGDVEAMLLAHQDLAGYSE